MGQHAVLWNTADANEVCRLEQGLKSHNETEVSTDLFFCIVISQCNKLLKRNKSRAETWFHSLNFEMWACRCGLIRLNDWRSLTCSSYITRESGVSRHNQIIFLIKDYEVKKHPYPWMKSSQYETCIQKKIDRMNFNFLPTSSTDVVSNLNIFSHKFT